MFKEHFEQGSDKIYATMWLKLEDEDVMLNEIKQS
jgi:hypothetical protein